MLLLQSVTNKIHDHAKQSEIIILPFYIFNIYVNHITTTLPFNSIHIHIIQPIYVAYISSKAEGEVKLTD